MDESELCKILKASTRCHRTSHEIDVVKRFIFDYFPDIPNFLSATNLNDFCNEINWMAPADKSILFLQNDPGHCYYMIARGGVNLYFEDDKSREALLQQRCGQSVGKPFRGFEGSLGHFLAQLKV